jgi:tripartite-type tricarboxylate transporter receptor subunit TctC
MRKLLVAIATFAGVAGVHAQTYLTRPVTLVVLYPAGGPLDALARVLAEMLRGTLEQTVVIENVSGAGGALGTGRVARAAPDGYTLSFGHVQTHVLNGASGTLGYDVVTDFEPVTLIADTPRLGSRRVEISPPGTSRRWWPG